MKSHWTAKLEALCACDDSVEWKPDSPRLEALGLVERYGRGEAVTRAELRDAARAASAIYAANAARYAAYAASYAAYAAWAANARLCGMIRAEYTSTEVWEMING